jgi:hypothetical protein
MAVAGITLVPTTMIGTSFAFCSWEDPPRSGPAGGVLGHELDAEQGQRPGDLAEHRLAHMAVPRLDILPGLFPCLSWIEN